MSTPRFRFVSQFSAAAVALTVLMVSTPLLAQGRYINLTWVDRSGEVVGVIGERGEYRGLDVSPDGTHVAVHAHIGAGGDVLIFDADGNATLRVADATGVQENMHPIFSPDGSRVVYGSRRDGESGLYIRNVDGSGQEELLYSSGRSMVPMSWSPDGRHIIYWETDNFEWVLPLDGERTPFRLMDANSSHSQISPDGRWVAYNANGDVWVRGFPDGDQAWKVSNDGGLFPRWRGDGREIYYTSSLSLGMVMASDVRETNDGLELSAAHGLFDTEYINMNHSSNYHTFAVSRDGERFLIPRPEPSELVVVDTQSNATREIASFFNAPEISPDGSRIAAVRGQRGVWVFDIETGAERELSALDEERRFAQWMAWAPDGESLAYVAIDIQAGRDVMHFVDASREGRPESEVMLPGLGGWIVGFGPGGRSALYFSPQLGGDVLFGVAIDGDHATEELARVRTGMLAPRLSPDGRTIAYHTNALSTNEVWVRSIDFDAGEFGEPVRVDGGFGMVTWSGDGEALYYVNQDRVVSRVSVTTAPTLAVGRPERVLDVPDAFPPEITDFDVLGTVSRDGRHVVFSVPPDQPPLALTELRVMDRNGNLVGTPGEPGLYGGRPILSPDGTRVLAGRTNRETNINELWAFDLDSGDERLIVADRNLNSWIWSEDGEELIYAIMDFNDPEGGTIFRAQTNGSGTPAMLYRHWPGTGFNLIDWSADGRFVLFNSGGVIHVLALDRDAAPVELIREEFFADQALISPDNRFVAFTSDETVQLNAWLWSFDPETMTLGPTTEKWQLTTEGAGGPLSWGRNGSEITYRDDAAIWSVELTFEPEFNAAEPRRLLPQPEGAGNASASRNGERWVFFAPAVGAR